MKKRNYYSLKLVICLRFQFLFLEKTLFKVEVKLIFQWGIWNSSVKRRKTSRRFFKIAGDKVTFCHNCSKI